MKVLVSGSSGLIGTALIDDLEADGHSVVRLVRGRRPSGPPSGEVSWDPAIGALDGDALERSGPYDAVVNLAGAGIGDRRWSPARKRLILDSRVRATTLLVDSLLSLSSRPSVLVSVSAIGVYGIAGNEELTEQSAAGTGFLADVCRAWEAAASPAADLGIRTIALRTGIVLSRTGGALAKQLPLFRIGLGGRMGSGTQYRSWITLADEVGVIRRCMEATGLSGPVNATAPSPATDHELAKALGAALRRPSILPVPAPALRLVLGTEMAEELVLGGQRVLPAVLLSSGYAFVHTQLDEAVRSVLTPIS